MKSFAWPLVLVIAGCDANETDDDFPVEPGGGDSVPVSGDPVETFTGRICISNTISNLSQCRPNNLGGFTVALGRSAVITDANGGFELPVPALATSSFRVTGPGVVPTSTPFSQSLTVPVVDADVWARTLQSNQIFAVPNTGAILGNVVRAGNAAQNITVASTPAGQFGPFFDTETGFGTNATGARGVFMVPGIATGTAGLTFTDTSGLETTVAGVQVVNGGVTILDSVVLP